MADDVKAPKKKVSLDQAKLSLGEMIMIEDITGRPMADELEPQPVIDPATGRKIPDPDDPKGRPLMKTPTPSARTISALLFVQLRRDDPSLTYQDVLEMDPSDIEYEGDEEENPTDEASD